LIYPERNQKVYVDGKTFSVSGEGYKLEGEVTLNDSKIDPLNHPELLLAGKLAAFVTNNGVVFDKEAKQW